MTGISEAQIEIGPLRVGANEVFLHTNSRDFEQIAHRSFTDLTASSVPATRVVHFQVIRQPGPRPTWAIYRNGAPCELELMEDAVAIHQQWEFNRLAIESSPTAIHSAAVARQSRAVLLLGASFSGKTTLAGWLSVHHDFEYLTDEVAAIDGRGRVVPYPRPLGVRSDSPLATLDLNRPMAAAGDSAPERLVPISNLGATVGSKPTPVDLLVFPKYEPAAELSTRHLDQADAFERLAALTPGLAAHGRVVFDRLCQLVETAPALALTYSDVRSAADVVVEVAERMRANQ